MAYGLHTVNMANKLLGTIGNTSFAAGAVSATKLHTSAGDPGSAGTSNPSSVTTRTASTWGTPATGQIATTATQTWSNWAGTNGEVVGSISQWDSTTAGVFLFSAALAVAKTMNTGDTLNITLITVTISPLAA
jgi:hypothetical protein